MTMVTKTLDGLLAWHCKSLSSRLHLIGFPNLFSLELVYSAYSQA